MPDIIRTITVSNDLEINVFSNGILKLHSDWIGDAISISPEELISLLVCFQNIIAENNLAAKSGE